MSFDLIFSGQVVTKFDPSRVQQDLGRLLNINDAGVLKLLFSGRTVVLQRNLERKTAAEQYREICKLGGTPKLVESGSADKDATDLASLLEKAPLNVRNTSPVNANTQRKNKPSQASLPQATSPPDSKLESIRKEMLALQQQINQAIKTAKHESGKLQRRKDHFERVAEKQMAQLEAARLTMSDESVATIEALERSAIDDKETTEREIAELEATEKLTLQRVKSETDKLLGLLIEAEDAEQCELRQLELDKAEATQRAQEEIDQLLQRIEQISLETNAKVEQIEQHTAEMAKSWQLERSALEREQTEIEQQGAERVQWLQQKRQDLGKELDEKLTRIEQQRYDIREARKDETLALEAKYAEANLRLDQGIARAERADSKAREKTKIELQRLHAKKLELQRAATVAMRRAGERTTLDIQPKNQLDAPNTRR